MTRNDADVTVDDSPRVVLSEDTGIWGLLILRSAVGVTILCMAAHHVITWQWFTNLLHLRFDSVFGAFVGESAGRSLVSFFCRFQTTVEFVIAIPLLIGIRIPVAAFGATLLFLMNTIGLGLEEIINPGDQHVQRLQVILWNHLQFLMAIGILAISALPGPTYGGPPIGNETSSSASGFRGLRYRIDGRALAMLCMRSYMSVQLLIPVGWVLWVYLRYPALVPSIGSDLLMPALRPFFPVIVIAIGLAAICIAAGFQIRPACAVAAIALLFTSCQCLMRKESQSGYSLYFQWMHAWNLVFLMFVELAIIATFWYYDRYSLDGWLRGSRSGILARQEQ